MKSADDTNLEGDINTEEVQNIMQKELDDLKVKEIGRNSIVPTAK